MNTPRNPLVVRSENELIDRRNELARRFYDELGHTVDRGHRFDRAALLPEIQVWKMAVAAYAFIDDRDIEMILVNRATPKN